MFCKVINKLPTSAVEEKQFIRVEWEVVDIIVHKNIHKTTASPKMFHSARVKTVMNASVSHITFF